MIYEYECNNCGNIQEEMHGVNETPEIKCNKCKDSTHRLITGGSGFILKGDGFSSSSSRFKKSMTEKNLKAGKKAANHNKSVSSVNDLQ